MGETMWRSAFPSADVTPAFVDDEVLHEAAAQADRPALVDAGSERQLTYRDLTARVAEVAGGLGALGIGRGDIVAMVAANCVEYACVLYGALRAGAAVASANPALTAGELARQFAKTRPRLVLSDAIAAAAVDEALAVTGCGAAQRSLHDPPLGAPPGLSARDTQDLAFLFPSSGTTGLPKVAVHTHAGATAFLRSLAAAGTLSVTADDVVGLVVPFTHLYGTALLSHSLRSGATVAAMTLAPFQLEAFLRLLQDQRVTVAPVTPPLILALARDPLIDRFDLSSLRLVLSGAAPCAPELQDEVEARLGCQVVDSLGSTEAWCYAPPASPPVRGSVGTVGADVEAVVVDPATGAHLGPGEPGELWIRGPQVMHGYLGDEDATREALDAHGWLHTGDVCRLDAAGSIYVVDRLKELIKVGGYSVAPAEVERELLAHPAVADAAVVGRPDGLKGEVPVAYVVFRRPVDGERLLAWLNGRLAPWKQPRDVVVVQRIPRSPTGKILRRELSARERGAMVAG
jgi:acyl-CoA synthetase (AMP-forming)/AMP-acid ligase II